MGLDIIIINGSFYANELNDVNESYDEFYDGNGNGPYDGNGNEPYDGHGNALNGSNGYVSWFLWINFIG